MGPRVNDILRKRLLQLCATATALACVALLLGCSQSAPRSSNAGQPDKPSKAFSHVGDAVLSSEEEAEIAAASAPLTYPTGWLIVDAQGIPAGTPCQVLSLPDVEVVAHRLGKAVEAEEQQRLHDELPHHDGGSAVVSFDDNTVAVDANLLLVNLPDIMPEAVYDIVYSYASTSNCAGIEVPRVTGEALPGYMAGEQDSPYWNEARFVVPCAYRTMLKAINASSELVESGYRLLVYDVYRPMQAQYRLANALLAAYQSNPDVQSSLGGWSIDWYVAPGSSGHNFGTDFDVGVCDSDGNPLAMPSSFDAFDETGHLTNSPMDASSISPASYRGDVAANDACLALHAAFLHAGFSELASEWWHFGDLSTEGMNRSIAGNGGLDFVARLI